MNYNEWIKNGKPMNCFINCDCLNAMKEFPDNYFELAIVDPPYGIGAEKFNLGTDCHKRLKSNWVDIAPDKKYFEQLQRISKNRIIWGGNYFTRYLEANNNWIVWHKNNSGVSFSMAELAWSSIVKNIQIFEFRPMGKLNKIHPTQKPVKLYQWLLQNYAKPGDKILDTHVGSGSSIIACIEEKHEYIGFELDADYYREATERIETFKSQGKLF